MTVRTVDALVVGAGVSGICAGVTLRRVGIEDFAIIDRAAEFGGTWHANTYPGIACDIPSQVYSYRFAPTHDWSKVFAPGAEIQRYLLEVVERFGLRAHADLDTTLQRAEWDDCDARWVAQTSRGEYRARVLLIATGVLEDPRIPDIAGLEAFPGAVFHSARWPEDAALDGRRVAVLGTGASSIQIVPEIQPRVSRLTVFQRTPPWVIPKMDLAHGRTFRELVRRYPVLRRALQRAQWAGVEMFLTSLYSRRASEIVSLLGKFNIRRSITDPHLRIALTPQYVLGCKRALMSNTYYKALAAANTEVVPAGVTEVRGNTLIAADGTERDVDAIVLATGFHFRDPPIYGLITGRDGRTLAERWDGRPEAYLGTAIAGCPNMFVFSGPNGSTASVFVSVEATAAYVGDALRMMRRQRLRSVAVRPGVASGWKARANEHLARTMHSVGGCTNQYVDRDNNNLTLFPSSMAEMQRIMSRFDLESYDTTPSTALNDAPPSASSAGARS